MGKRRNEQPAGGDGKRRVPKAQQSRREGSEAPADAGLDASGAAQAGDADRNPKPDAGGAEDRGETTHSRAGSATTSAPGGENGDGEAAAPEPSPAAERVPSPLPQERRDAGGGGKSPEAAVPRAAPQPESPQRASSAADATEEGQLVATTEGRGSASEEPDAETQTCRRTGEIGDSPERGSAAPARGEGVAGTEIALPADAAGRSAGSGTPAEVPDPHREAGVNHSKPGKRRGDGDGSQEPPHAAAVNAEGNECGAASEKAAGGENWENASEEQPRATSTSDAVRNAAESRCSLAGGSGSTEVLGVCAPSAEGGTAEPESAGAAGAVGPVSRPQGGSDSPCKTPGEAGVGREEAGGGETPSPGHSSVPDPAGGNPSGQREDEGLAEECGAGRAPRTETQPPARSGALPHGTGMAESAPAVTAMPGPAPTGAAGPPAAGEGSAVSTEALDKASLAGEQLCPPPVPGGNGLRLPPQQPMPDAGRGDAAGRGPCAAAGRSRTAATTTLAEGNGPELPQPRNVLPLPVAVRGEEPEEPRGEDMTDVVCGLILELSNLNRLAMSAHRGLEALRRPRPRRGRRPGTGTVPPQAGRRWKEM